ncbi:mucin-19-like [Amphibalanus amphitrite]|uniref:mucin-19-like n=1 Tax=Amphibalanus amphitrite TaxID=1232801 RepID=UPI001C908A87|nr:mucin-19-like [Amphibalanus amphitrite]
MRNPKQLEVDQMKNQKQLEAQAAPQLQQLPIPQELFSCGGKAPATTASTIFGSGFSKTTPSTGTVSSTNGGLRFGQAPSAWTGGTTTGASAAASTGFSFGPTTAPPAQPSTPSFSFRPPTAEGATSTPAKARGENTTEDGPVSSTSGSGAAVSNTTTSSAATSAPAAAPAAATESGFSLYNAEYLVIYKPNISGFSFGSRFGGTPAAQSTATDGPSTSFTFRLPATASATAAATDSDPDEVTVVGEVQPTEEQRAAAARLQLPAGFYLYEQRPPCRGCRGCWDQMPGEARGENTTEEGPVSSTSGSGAAVSSTTTPSVVTSAPAAGAGAATPNSSFHFKAAPFWFAFGGDQSKVVEATPKATFEFGVTSAASSPFKFSFGGDADKSRSSIFGGAAAADTKTTSIFGGSSGNKTTSNFGGASSTETKPASIFGGTPSSETKTTSIFGTPSVFGEKGTDKAVSLFGGATTGDKTSKEDQIFGGSGTDSKPASLFGGFGVASGAQSSPFGSGSSVFGGWPSFGSAASKPASSESGAVAKPPTPANSSAPKAPEPISSGSAPSAPPAAATGSTGAGAAVTPTPSAPPAADTGSTGAGAAATPAPSAPPAAATGSTGAGTASTPAPTNGPSTETSINDTAQRGLQSPAASDVSKRTSSQFPAASVVTVQKQELSTVKQLKQFTFPPGLAELQVIAILESLQVQTLKELTVSTPPDSTGRWLQLLPPSLRRLDVYGPGETGKPARLGNGRQPDHGLVVVIMQAGDDVISQMATELGPRVTGLNMFYCPRVTAGALQRLLSALTGLEDVTFNGTLSGAITDASLAALHGCSQLRIMQLGTPTVLCTDIPVTAVSRLVVSCRKLVWLNFQATEELSQTVLDALVRADLGKRDDNTPRTLRFGVPEPAYGKLRQKSTSSIKVLKAT